MVVNMPLLQRKFQGPFSPESFPDTGIMNPDIRSLPVSPFGQRDEITDESLGFNPEHAAIDRFNQLLTQRPVRERPGFIRTLASGLIGGLSGDLSNVEKLLYAPYNQKVLDYNAQLEPAFQAANIERQSNANRRQLAYQTAENLRKERADTERTRLGEMKLEQDRIKEEARQEDQKVRTQLLQFKTMNPEYKIDTSGETVRLINPRTGQIIDTRYDTTRMSDFEKMMYSQQNALELLTKKQEGDISLEQERQKGRLESINLRESLTEGEETAANRRTRLRTNAEQLIREDPNGLGKFIKLDPNNPNGFSFIESTSGLFGMGAKTGPTDEERKKINNYILNQGARGISSTKTITAPIAPAGWKYVPKLDASGKQIGWTPVREEK
jgi:hypothetical protein